MDTRSVYPQRRGERSRKPREFPDYPRPHLIPPNLVLPQQVPRDMARPFRLNIQGPLPCRLLTPSSTSDLSHLFGDMTTCYNRCPYVMSALNRVGTNFSRLRIEGIAPNNSTTLVSVLPSLVLTRDSRTLLAGDGWLGACNSCDRCILSISAYAEPWRRRSTVLLVQRHPGPRSFQET